MSLNQLILLFSFLAELGLLTFARGRAGLYLSPVLFFIFSLLVGLLPLFTFSKAIYNRRILPFTNFKSRKTKLLSLSLIFIGGTIISVFILKEIFNSFNPDYRVSDIIPFIKVMVNRLLNGEFAYAPFSGFGYCIYPNYLPLVWLPFTFGEWFQCDYRWIAFTIWLIAVLLYFLYIFRRKYSVIQTVILSILPFLFLYFCTKNIRDAFENTIECSIAGFYMILGLSILNGKLFYKSTAIIFTLLSRFSVIFWVPFELIVVFVAESRKKAIILTGIIISAVVFIYIIPFLSKDYRIFQKGMAYYDVATLGEWHPKAFQNKNDRPFHLSKGVGAAIYFYDFSKEDAATKISVLKKVHLLLSVSIILLLSLAFIKYRNKYDPRVFSLSALKIYLAVFYTFIQIPYCYLYIVPVFLSIVLVASGFEKYEQQIVK